MSEVRTQISELSIWVPLPPVELSKNGRANVYVRNQIFQQHKMLSRSAINRVLPSGFIAWTGPVDVHIVWHQSSQRYWPDRDNLITRCAAYMDGAEGKDNGAGLFVNDKQVRSFKVDYEKDTNEGVSITFTHDEGAADG